MPMMLYRGKKGMKMAEQMKRRMRRFLLRKRTMRSSAVLTLCFLLGAALMISGCSPAEEESSSSGGESAGVTAEQMKIWFGPAIAETMSDAQSESLAQKLLTVVGDTRMADGTAVTLDAALRDEGRILLSFTVDGDHKLNPAAGKIKSEKSWIRSYETERELKKALPDLSQQEIEEYLNEIKKMQDGGTESLKNPLELTSFEGEDGSQHMLMQLDTSSDVEIFYIHLEDFNGISGPFDFEVKLPVGKMTLTYSGAVPMQAEEGMEMTLTKVVIRPLSGVSADLTRDGGAGSLPENDEEFSTSVTMNMVRWNDIEVADASVSIDTDGGSVVTSMNDYAGKVITPEDVTAVKIGGRWIELDQMTLSESNDTDK